MSPRMSTSNGGTTARAWAVCPLTLSVAMTMAVPGLAQAEPENPNSLSALVGAVADANQRLRTSAPRCRSSRRASTRPSSRSPDAREAAATAQQEVESSRMAVKDANAAISTAQKKFDVFAASTYVADRPRRWCWPGPRTR